jgi:hypothetical protein
MEKFLIRNAVLCLSCGEELISYFRHDYKICSCFNDTFVDGGLDYRRFGGVDLELVVDSSIYSDDPFETVRQFLFRGSRGKSGKEELTYVLLKDMDTDWLENVIKYEEELRPNNKYLQFYKQELNFRKNENTRRLH